MFENKVLERYLRLRETITGEWRKVHNAELHALYSSANIIRNLKSRRLRLEGHVVTYVWSNPEMHTEFSRENLGVIDL